MKNRYSAKSIGDISIPFCFDCLLRLADEKDLYIKGQSQDITGDFVLGDDNPWLKDDAVLNEIIIIQDFCTPLFEFSLFMCCKLRIMCKSNNNVL